VTEQPWVPDERHMPGGITVALFNPNGDRHLGFDTDCGQFARLWQHRPPERLSATDAIALRPSDIDQIIKCAFIWIARNPQSPRASTLVDELATGAKGLVMHYARLAGQRPNS
jgi:hypothetical protein